MLKFSKIKIWSWFWCWKLLNFWQKFDRRLGRVYCAILSWDKVFWTELLSLNLQMTRILMFQRRKKLCIANTHRIVLPSHSLVHNTTSSGHVTRHFGHSIWRPFWEQNHTPFRHYKIANFFQIWFKLWNTCSVFKMANFQNIEKLILLHMHFKLI